MHKILNITYFTYNTIKRCIKMHKIFNKVFVFVSTVRNSFHVFLF